MDDLKSYENLYNFLKDKEEHSLLLAFLDDVNDYIKYSLQKLDNHSENISLNSDRIQKLER